jgi:NodT family efflux transporter outer membrane factor (OMF) lipoprotein
MKIPSRFKPHPLLLAAALSAALSACALPIAPATKAVEAPTRWYAPLPHDGRTAELDRWWQQFDDPLLSRLIAASQNASPTLASAAARIAQARAARVASGAASTPSVQALASAERGKDVPGGSITTSSAGGLQVSWEIDLFGGLAAGRSAAQARYESAHGSWHDARVSLAAEVATSYTSLRACEAQLVIAAADAGSRAETARLTAQATRAGVQTPAQEALARASAAQGAVNLSQQRAQCELSVKSLVALTAIDEDQLRVELAGATARVPQPASFAVGSVPAQALSQRPDLFVAERDVIAAAADIAQSQAQLWPRLTLGGSIGPARVQTPMASANGTVWSVGPVQLTLPVFDGGVLRSDIEAAQARYDEATALYRARLRSAVNEVESALVTLNSVAERSADTQIAAEGFRASFVASQSRQRAGVASLFELEDARRSDLAAQIAVIDLQRESTTAWISLYRALGGGWQPEQSEALSTAPTTQRNS